MLLSVCFEDINKWVSLFADIATCITALTAIGALVSAIIYFKNRATNKTFQISFKVQSILEYDDYSRFHCYIDICNFTDKEFSIIECNLIFNNQHYIMEERYKIFPNSQLVDYRPLKNIALYAYQSTTLSNAYFRLPKIDNHTAILEVKTTQKTLKYKVNLDEQNF